MSSDPRRTARPRQWCQCIQEKALRVCDPLRAHLCIPCRGESHANMCTFNTLMQFTLSQPWFFFLAVAFRILIVPGNFTLRPWPVVKIASITLQEKQHEYLVLKHMHTDALMLGFQATLLDFTIWNNWLCFYEFMNILFWHEKMWWNILKCLKIKYLKCFSACKNLVKSFKIQRHWEFISQSQFILLMNLLYSCK